MTITQNQPSIETTARATIKAARALQTALDESPLDLQQDALRIRGMLDAFRAGELYRDRDEATLDLLQTLLLEALTARAPGYREIALHCDTDDFAFLDPELEAIRRLWEQLRRVRNLRQTVLDQLAAERQVNALRRRSLATNT
ncbi:hypothetical protein BMG03_19215 (plasmid) [Thioclava nitratireducens]|uniref:Uncharacterized protein n=1 Tax=Thioclava nitratireducens TaxID=1915078 RepID=A0ABM6IMM6_9RHOB|nr:hypothetical protein [Thioclava nitratireducens]AQS50056.1 hypothetical protein BMG03_19215 [Thioclava nitratireducens]